MESIPIYRKDKGVWLSYRSKEDTIRKEDDESEFCFFFLIMGGTIWTLISDMQSIIAALKEFIA